MPAVIFLSRQVPLPAQSLLCINKIMNAPAEIALEEAAEKTSERVLRGL